MRARVPALVLAAMFGAWAAGTPPANAQRADETGCVASAVDNDLPGVGERCTAILDDPSTSHEARVAALLTRAVWHYRAGRYNEARQDLDNGLDLEAEHPKLLQLRASLHVDEGQLEEAEALAKKSAEIDPNRASTFETLAAVAERKGDRRSRLAYLDRAIELRSDYAIARFMRARLLVSLSRAPEALTDTIWLIAQAPADNDRAGWAVVNYQRVKLHIASLVLHGEVLQAMDRFKEAEAHFNSVVAYQRDAFTLTQRSIFLDTLPTGAGMQSRLKEAMSDAEEAVRLAPGNSRALRQYSSTLEYAKRPADALAVIDKAIESEPLEWALPPLLWMRARNLRALLRREEAIETASASLELGLALNRTFFQDRTSRLVRLGYLQSSESLPREWTPALDNAVAACMSDDKCW